MFPLGVSFITISFKLSRILDISNPIVYLMVFFFFSELTHRAT